MSQIFDSLRRSRKSDTRSTPSRTARGDAVLTTLGYAPPVPRRRYRPVVVGVALILVTAATAWMAWRAYLDLDATPAASARVLSPGMPKPAPPPARPMTPPALPAAAKPSPEDADAPAQTAEVSNVGRRVARADSRRAVRDPGSELPSDPGPTVSRPPASDLELALYYHRTGDYPKALQRYQALLQQNELNAQAHNNLGLLYQQRNLLQESARELQRAVVLEPRNAGTRNNYGVTLLMLGQVDHAAAEFQTALWLEPQNLDALINLSLVQRRTGQLDTAKETLLHVLNVAPSNAPAHYNLGQLYDDTNERARAVEHYRLFLDNAGADHADRAALVRARIAALNTMSK